MQKILVLITLLFIGQVSAQTVVSGTGVGPIPDNNPSGLVINFSVNGLEKPLESVSLSINANHTWVGDLTMTLISPNGLAQIDVFGRSGRQRNVNFGSNTNLAGTYVFNDQAILDWWAAFDGQTTSFDIPPGTYRSSTTGTNLSDFGGCSTRMNGAFFGLTSLQANGVWTLLVSDFESGDLGSIDSATLTLNEQSEIDLIYADGFDGISYASFATLPASGVTGNCTKSRFDFTGNGLADYSIAADDTFGGIDWTVQDNDGTTTGAIQLFKFGNPATDYIMDGDIDGDGIKDAILWRSAPEGVAAYYVRRSSRPDDKTLKFTMGQSGNSPTQIGDYDGDGIEDFAVFSAPSVTGPTKLIVHESSTGMIREINLVEGTSFSIFTTGGYDYTGDGIADVALQRTSLINPGIGEHLIFNGLTGGFFQAFEFGNNTDLLIPGNYVGDNRADINIARILSGNRNWYTRETGTGTTIGPTVFGVTGNTVLSGDYDGDGFDDYGVYNSTAFRFEIRPSSNPGTPIQVNMGASGIYPIANSRVQ